MKTNYYVNKEKGVVICKIKDDWGDTYKYEIVGRADCSPDDVFDEQIGRRIAELRAHIAFHTQTASLLLKKREEIIQDRVVLLSKEILRKDTIIQKMKAQIKEITK